LERPRRRPDTLFPILVAFVGCADVQGKPIPASLRALATSLRVGLASAHDLRAADSIEEMPCVRRDGSAIDVSARAARLGWTDNADAGLVIVAADASNAQGAERALLLAAEAETARLVSQARLDDVRLTVRSVVHLVNNRLAEAVGYLDLLCLQHRLSPDAAAAIVRSQRSIDAATKQIARPAAGRARRDLGDAGWAGARPRALGRSRRSFRVRTLARRAGSLDNRQRLGYS
jgi:hypothetical protein